MREDHLDSLDTVARSFDLVKFSIISHNIPRINSALTPNI